MGEKHNILLFGLKNAEIGAIEHYFGQKYTVLDVSACFTDVLAIPAKIIILNPAKLTHRDYLQMNEIFTWDDETHIIFTEKPCFPMDVSKVLFPYYVEDNLEHLSENNPLEVEEILKLEEGYDDAVENMGTLLEKIEHSIRRDFEEMSLASKTVSIRQGCLAYQYFLDIVLFRNAMPLKLRTRYRHEMLNMLLAFKLACGLISDEDLIPYDLYMHEQDVTQDAGLRYITSMAEAIRSRIYQQECTK